MMKLAIHGNGQSNKIWDAFKQLSDFITPDLPGHGQGPRLEKYSLEIHAEYIASLIGEPVHLIGHSMGGHVAIRVAKLISHKIKKLTLIGMAPLSSLDEMENYFAPDERTQILFNEKITRDGSRDLSLVMQIDQSFEPLIYQMLENQDPKHRIQFVPSLMQYFQDEKAILNSLDCDIQFLVGAKDKALQLEYVLSNGVNISVVENAGHNIMFDCPEYVLRHLE